MRKASRRSAGKTGGGKKRKKRGFITQQHKQRDEGKMKETELRRANGYPLMLTLTNPLFKMFASNAFTQEDAEEILGKMSFCCYFNKLSVHQSPDVYFFLVHMCKTVTSSGEIPTCCHLSAAHCVHAAAMRGLWDLRLTMTNGGQAGAAES